MSGHGTYPDRKNRSSVDPFYEYKPVYPKAKQKYLTLQELESIINTPFREEPLVITRDLFLFSCFTGLAYTDICNLKGTNIVKASDCVTWVRTSRREDWQRHGGTGSETGKPV